MAQVTLEKAKRKIHTALRCFRRGLSQSSLRIWIKSGLEIATVSCDYSGSSQTCSFQLCKSSRTTLALWITWPISQGQKNPILMSDYIDHPISPTACYSNYNCVHLSGLAVKGTRFLTHCCLGNVHWIIIFHGRLWPIDILFKNALLTTVFPKPR